MPTDTTPHAAAPALPTFEALKAALVARGFVPGFPETVTPHCRGLDRRIATRRRCGGCGARGMALHPYRRGDRYAALARCTGCPAAEEV